MVKDGMMYKVKELKMITADGWETVGVEIEIEIKRVNVLRLLFGAVHWPAKNINLHRKVNSLKVCTMCVWNIK